MSLERATGTSPRGTWEYLAWRPPDLASFVEVLWSFTGPTVNARKRVFPTGCVELILNLAEPYEVVAGAATHAMGGAFITGMMEGPLVLVQPAWQRCLAARLTPRGARALLALPLHEITGLSVDLADVIGAAAGDVLERCAALGPRDGLSLLATWISSCVRRTAPADAAIARAATCIFRRGGELTIAELGRDLGVSRAALATRFRDHVGLTPKRYGRIVRVRRILAQLQRGHAPLARMAQDGGFYDQAHMNVEFRALTGITPGQFLAARHPVGDGATAAD
jgi:AraC-like DNA-binding protein